MVNNQIGDKWSYQESCNFNQNFDQEQNEPNKKQEQYQHYIQRPSDMSQTLLKQLTPHQAYSFNPWSSMFTASMQEVNMMSVPA